MKWMKNSLYIVLFVTLCVFSVFAADLATKASLENYPDMFLNNDITITTPNHWKFMCDDTFSANFIHGEIRIVVPVVVEVVLLNAFQA